MPSLRRHEGELSIDHRDSPGLPRGFGYVPGKPLPATAPGGVKVESPTYTCSHCGVVVYMNPQRTRPHEYCARCDHYVCPQPACALDCRPLKKMLDLAYAAIARSEVVQFAPAAAPVPKPLYSPTGAVLTSTGPVAQPAPASIFGPHGGLLRKAG